MLAEAVNLQRQTLIAGLRTEEGDVCVPVVVLRGAARKGVVPLPNKLLCPRDDFGGNARIGKRRVGDVVGVAAIGLVEQQIQPACQNHKIQQVQQNLLPINIQRDIHGFPPALLIGRR